MLGFLLLLICSDIKYKYKPYTNTTLSYKQLQARIQIWFLQVNNHITKALLSLFMG